MLKHNLREDRADVIVPARDFQQSTELGKFHKFSFLKFLFRWINSRIYDDKVKK